MIDTQLFRQAMGRFATGITVVTAKDEAEPRGMTVNAFMSLSLDPILIAISIGNKARMCETLAKVDRFGVSILSEAQQQLSMVFAKQMQAEQPVDFDYIQQTPVLPEALVQLVCEKESEVEAGDHTIFIAKVIDLETQAGDPLIYFGGQYRRLN